MYNSFRKLFLAVVVIAAIPLFHTYAHAAYTTDFETTESYSWGTIMNTDTVEPITSDWAGVVTKPYGADENNQALAIKTGADQYAEYGTFDTGYINTPLANNPVTGNLMLTLDFMIDSSGWDALGANVETKMITTRMTNGTEQSYIEIVRVIKRSAGHGQLLLSDMRTVIGKIQPDRWNRITIAFSPATGKATFNLITNVDGDDAVLVSLIGYQLTDADVYTGINRIKLDMNPPNIKFYFDNLSLHECEGITLTAVSPISGDNGADADGGITLVFNEKVASQDFTLNGRAVTLDADESGTVLKYSGSLIGNREYSLQGIVADENGRTRQVNHQFKTASTLRLISGTVRNGDTGITPTDTLLFKFNHRIDPCDNSFSITEGAEIESYNVKGNILEIKLNEVLEYNKYYTLKLDGLGDLYSEEYYEPHITFKTSGLDVNYAEFVDTNGEPLSEIDSSNTRYTAEFINNTTDLQKIIFVMTLTENNRITKIVVTPYSVEPGDKLNIDESFAGVDTEKSDCLIKVFYLESFQTLRPYDTKMMPVKTLGRQNDM